MTKLITKHDMLLENLSKLKTGIAKFVGVTRKECLKKPRKKYTDETEIPDRFKFVDKVTYNTAKICTDYSYEVNKMLESENKTTTFKSKGTYCEPVSDNCLVWKHKTASTHYVRVYPSLAEKHDTITVFYDALGNIITKKEFESAEKKYLQGFQEEVKTRQGTDTPIIVNNYKFDNIKWLEIDGEIIINELDDTILEKLTRPAA